MKKVIVIFLLLQIVTNNAFAEQLLKVPGLILHYNHHTTQHKNSGSFYDFLYKHYSGISEKESHGDSKHEEDKDCHLPFKHCGNCCTNAHSPALGFVASYLSADCTFASLRAVDFLPSNDAIESLDINNIWQPPKIS